MGMHLNALFQNDSKILAIPIDNTDKRTLWHLYVTFMCACAPRPAQPRPPAGTLSAAELRHHLLTILRGDVEAHVHVAHAALGACHIEHLPLVFQVCK